jgi:sortase A
VNVGTVRRCVSSVLLLAALWAGGNAAYIVVKAELAQYLLEKAWRTSRAGAERIPPWPSADTWPVARLSFPQLGKELLVLSGASGRNLAFGPAHFSDSPWPGVGGSTFIAGHRDTHFKVLQDLPIGEEVALERLGVRRVFRVAATEIVHQDDAALLAGGAPNSLVLITCYPFDGLDPGTPWRYVVLAVPRTPHSVERS